MFESINASNIVDCYYLTDNKTTLNDNETLLGIDRFRELLDKEVNEYIKILNETARKDQADELREKYEATYPFIHWLAEGIKYDEELQKEVEITDTDIANYLQEIKEFVSYFEELLGRDFTIRYCVNMPSGSISTEKTMSIEGFLIYPQERHIWACYLSPNDYETYRNANKEKSKEQNGGNYWHDEVVTNYIEPKTAKYSMILINFDHSSSQINELVKIIDILGEDDSFITLESPITKGLTMADNLINSLSKVFLILGIVLAVFSSLLLCNFISVSISHKKKEIGILRAVGARSLDVFKIFFSESFVIVLICIVLSIVGAGFICNLLNAEISVILSGVTVFVFGPVSILLLVGLAFLTTLLATFFPVNSAARKKPVESIRAL